MLRIAIAVIALISAGCYTGPGVDRFVAIADELHIPADWAPEGSTLRGPDQTEQCDPFESSSCPAAIRSYLAPLNGPDAYDQAKSIVTEAGFAVTYEMLPCTEPLSPQGCGFFALRDQDRFFVRVYRRLTDAGLAGPPTSTTVRFSAERA